MKILIDKYKNGNISTKGEVDWYEFTTSTGAGAYNIYSVGSSDMVGLLYKKNALGQLVLVKQNDDTTFLNQNFRLEVDLKSNKTYYLCVKNFSGFATGTYGLYVEENVDRMYSPEGGAWTRGTVENDPDGSFYAVTKVVYMDKETTENFENAFGDDAYRKWRDTAVNVTTGLTSTYLISKTPLRNWLTVWLLGAPTGYMMPKLTEIELEAISEAANEQENGEFSNGIKITTVITYTTDEHGHIISATQNLFSPWDGKYIEGKERYRGEFDINDQYPDWR